MPVPLFDLTRQYAALQTDIEAAALRVLRSGRYILGDEVEAFESEVATYMSAKHVVGASSGTDALLAALIALGVGPGDRVAVPVYSFFATAGVVVRLGATPVFVDVEPTWCNIDVDALRRTLEADADIAAVIFVHLYGAGNGIAEVAALCADRGVPLIEDTAQAIGARVDGKAAGTFGLCGCFSTFPTKNLGGVGEGGFLSTEDDEFAERLRRTRNHGQTGAYDHAFVGGNFRLDALQAACLRVKLQHIEEFTAARRANAARYREGFAAAGIADTLRIPTDIPDRHAYHQFVVHIQGADRDAVRQHMTERGVGCSVYYPIPFHRQPCFADLGHDPEEFPVAEQASRTNLALPIFPELRAEEQDEVISTLAEALRVAK